MVEAAMSRAPGAAALTLVCALFATGCSRCGRPGGAVADPVQFLPAGPAAALLIPSLEEAVAQIAPLEKALSQGPGGAEIAAWTQTLRTQLGFDPLSTRGIGESGVDPGRGAAVAIAWGGPPLIVLPVADAARFDALVIKLARDRMGANHRLSTDVGGKAVVSYRPINAPKPSLAYTLERGFALLAPGPESIAVVAAAAGRAEADSLAASPAWSRARSALGTGFAAVAFAPPGSPALSAVPLARDGGAAGLKTAASRVMLRAALLLAADRSPSWQAMLGRGGTPAARELGSEEVSRLPVESVLVFRYGGEPAALGPRLLPLISPAARSRLAAAQLDPQRDLLDNLAPGAALSVSVAPTLEIAKVAAGPRALDPRRQNPFSMVHLAALGRVRDPARAQEVLERIAKAAPKIEAKITARPVEAKGSLPAGTAWTATYAKGEGLAWALLGDRILATGGPGRLDALMGAVSSGATGYAPRSAESRSALGGGVAGGLIDMHNLVASIRSLPSEAYGTGPDGFVMRAMAGRIIEPASRLDAATVRLEVLEDVAVAELGLEARQARPGAP
jgi:hypothetical protein